MKETKHNFLNASPKKVMFSLLFSLEREQVFLRPEKFMKSNFLKKVENRMGYSRKNPHLPDGWYAGNSRGRGVEGSGSPGGRGI